MKKGLILLMSVFACLMLVGCDKKNNTNNNGGNGGDIIDDGNGGNPQNPGNDPQNPTTNIPSIKLDNDFKEVSLNKEYEQIKINDLTLGFYGEDVSSQTGVQGSYQYVLTLDLGGVELNSNIYSNPYKRLINSSNLASSFRIYAVDGLYILKSNTGAQIDGENALVIDKEGNFIDSFEDIVFDIDIKNKKINYTNCITTDPSEQCIKSEYTISGNVMQKK